ncbi:MAG TPA: SPOR domain-containing protein [Ramlibacter sp.]
MALFKLRKKKVDEPVAAASPAESIEVMRRRARHRLIGAVVLVLAGVIGFPLLFDTQPRPVAVDIPIEIPDRNKVKPLAPPQAPQAAGKVSQAPVPVPAPATPVVTESKPEAASAPPPQAEAPPAAVEKAAKAEPVPEKKPEARAEAKPEARVAEVSKAKALLEGKSVDAGTGGRYVVQVGAFAEKDKARQAQQKLERAGLKNYTNVAETKNGTRIRVRAGPFASRAEADKAAQKIKGLDLPAAVLTL